ncbi:hypothetical protein [Gallaecimonas sp. GXIMD4217]|uniref:hypothetical protein n=1 Tax=Gallaecimonas sp. GXIMD4217 TaxID=3131927 RepID=UPI00311AE77F
MTDYTQDFARVREDEAAWLKARREAAGIDPGREQLGLAFSGGGIRSACFQLGVLQGMVDKGWLNRVDYLSSVSGGGYTAGSLQWRKRDRWDDGGLFELPFLNWLRAHASYLVAGKDVGGATLGAAIFASVLFSLMVLLPMLLAVLWLAGLPHSALPWPDGWHLSGSDAIEGHAGYLLMLALSGLCFGLYLLSIPTMALWRGGRMVHNFRQRRLMGRLVALAITLALVGSLPMAAQLGDGLAALLEGTRLAGLGVHLNYAVPMTSGALALSRARIKLKFRPGWLLAGLSLMLYGLAAFGYHLVFHKGVVEHWSFWLWLASATILSLAASVNRSSMHGYYLAQLTRAFFHPGGKGVRDLPLAELRPDTGAPLALFNTTVATGNSDRPLARSRLGDSFTLSPLYCGNPASGFAKTAAFQSGRLTLGEAVTTSGAAVDPGTSHTAPKSLSFLMALLNLRLGFWVRHPRLAGSRFSHMPFWLVIKEMLGVGLREDARQLRLSDGGHFENLGVYELLRRECPLIISCDAGADPETRLADLGLLLQRAHADFGCHIHLNTAPLTRVEGGLHQSCHVMGEIRYASGKVGRLLFVKALLTEASSGQVTCFDRIDEHFPNDSTANQFFDERHFDAYRSLGRENIAMALAALEGQQERAKAEGLSPARSEA